MSLTLSDAFCVARFRDEFLDLAEKYVDILFANESEILSLYQTEDFDEALQQVRKHCEIAALTRSEKGSVVVNGDEVHVIDAVKGVKVVDTTGAGDAYAAGSSTPTRRARPQDLRQARWRDGGAGDQPYGPRAEKAEIVKTQGIECSERPGGSEDPPLRSATVAARLQTRRSRHRSNDSRRPIPTGESRSAPGRVETSPAVPPGCRRRRS